MTPARSQGYADRSHQPTLAKVRNFKAVQAARDQELPLVISFIGDTDWPNPTVYCDSGERYDWSFVRGLRTIIAVKAGVTLLDALPSILEHSDTIGLGYPVLVDVDQKEVACLVEGDPVQLWQIRSGTDLWQQYFAP